MRNILPVLQIFLPDLLAPQGAPALPAPVQPDGERTGRAAAPDRGRRGARPAPCGSATGTAGAPAPHPRTNKKYIFNNIIFLRFHHSITPKILYKIN